MIDLNSNFFALYKINAGKLIILKLFNDLFKDKYSLSQTYTSQS